MAARVDRVPKTLKRVPKVSARVLGALETSTLSLGEGTLSSHLGISKVAMAHRGQGTLGHRKISASKVDMKIILAIIV